MKSRIGKLSKGQLSRAIGALVTVACVVVMMAQTASAAPPVAFAVGDVMAGVGNGSVKQFDPTGVLKDTLVGTPSSFTTGMAFDSAGNLYVTDFNAGNVDKYDTNGNFLGAFITGLTGSPESLTFDAAGNLYVGQADGARDVRKYDSTGAFLASYPVATGPRGSDWIDLAADQCTLFYTSEGALVKRYNVCTNAPLADFATLPSLNAYALRIRPNGDVIVAATNAVYRLDSTGTLVQTYTIPGASLLFGMNLDPDGTSFWTGDLSTGAINRVDIASGAIITTFNSAPLVELDGLAVVGEIRAALNSTISLAPLTATNPVGTNHTVTATVTENSIPVAGKTVTFTVTSGPNTGVTGTGVTDLNGQAAFTYTSSLPGTDVIQATYVDSAGKTKTSNTVQKTWIVVNADLSITKIGPAFVQTGGMVTYIITVSNGGPANATNVVVSDPLPAGETLVSATPSQGTCGAPAVTCSLGPIANGLSASVTIVANVTAATGTTVANTATVIGDQPDPTAGNNSSTTSAFVYGVVAGGNFVIGNQNAALGTNVTFWGAQWWKLNGLTGGTAPAAFKGFANKPAGVAACGVNWTTSPGNSPPPPAGPLPAYMAVIVSSSIGQSGPTISGNTVHVVIVKTNAGYMPDPGHAGTGKVVARIC